jgi:hypothetical protein
MTALKEIYTNEQTEISYTLSADGNYYIPDIAVPVEPDYDIGIWGLRRLSFIKNHRKGLYTILLTSEKLSEHLHEIDETAFNRMEQIARQMAVQEGVTETVKAENQLLWIQKMNSIRNRVEEIIREELIYS